MPFISRLICSVLFVGYIPLVPGTWGSAAGLAVWYCIRQDLRLVLLALAVSLALGFALGTAAEKAMGKKDPGPVVIDEFAGMFISLLFVPHINSDLKLILIGFLMFRIFDTFKPFPAQRLQSIHGGAGIMLDDVFAGLYTNLVLQILARFI
ncbi:MAG: phosphatidylglycerophosphatase A [Deltaproteobacteria bacterium]